jgi:hypothetical protein
MPTDTGKKGMLLNQVYTGRADGLTRLINQTGNNNLWSGYKVKVKKPIGRVN